MVSVRSPSTHNVLIVPMQLDALCLAAALEVREPFADLGRMPFRYKDVNGNWKDSQFTKIANLSENILSQPLTHKVLTLEAGVHLHWALPDALTQSEDSDDQGRLRFPIVPNRWLVTRRRGTTVEQQWVVESDHLYPDLSGVRAEYGEPPHAVMVPFSRFDALAGPYQRYRHMGRAVQASAYDPAPAGDHLRQFGLALTALGPEPWVEALDPLKGTFAAYYPGCFSVFGFHDAGAALGGDPRGLEYEVLGWYDRADDDVLARWLAAYPDPADPVQRREDFEERFQWRIEGDDAAFPARTVCHARLTFAGAPAENRALASRSARTVDLAIGNTGTEALAAYLAQRLEPGDKRIVEEQLTALPLVDDLDQQRADSEARFYEARHASGFTALAGGLTWSVIPAEPPEDTEERTAVPDDIAVALAALNRLQGDYDRERQVVAAMSQRLFNDWHKWMYCTHPDDFGWPIESTDDPRPPASDLGTLYRVLTLGGVNPHRQRICATGELRFAQQRRTRRVAAEPAVLRFDVVARHHAYFASYLAELEADYPQRYWKEELKACGVTLSSSASVVPVAGEAETWDIVDAGERYRVWVERGVMKLEIPPRADQLAVRLADAIAALQVRAAALEPPCVLEAGAGARFWQPNDPVVLMVGDAIQPGTRHGRDGRLRSDGLLACRLLEGVTDAALVRLPLESALQARIRQALEGALAAAAEPRAGGVRAGFADWTEQPWNPFLLEWQVQLFPHPLEDAGGRKRYPADHVTRRYSLQPEATDLRFDGSGDGDFVANAEPYSGMSLFSDHASGELGDWIAGYVVRERLRLPSPHDHDLYGLSIAQAKEYLDEHARAIAEAYPNPQLDDALYTALRAYLELGGMRTLSQALGGLNDALVMQRRVLQLDLDDPNGDQDSEILAQQIAGQTRGTLLEASMPRQEFNPIRGGELRITGLRIADTFGRMLDVSTNPVEGTRIVSSELLPIVVHDDDDHRVRLLPRLAQPARIQLRWLPATELEAPGALAALAARALRAARRAPELHPALSPICGWILPNNLDGSLMVHDAEGGPLGVVNALGHWDPFPGGHQAVALDVLPDPHLRRVVRYLTAAGRAGAPYAHAFLEAVNSALDQSSPELAHDPSLALLIGRPLAVVRASVDLEIRGLPARDKRWRTIRDAIAAYKANGTVTPISESPEAWTLGFDQIELPIRIGEYRQLGDGVLGYWVEDEAGEYAEGAFYAPQTGHAGFPGSEVDPRRIVTERSGPVHLLQTVGAPAQRLTLLVDPRGAVHATSGILPAKALRIPPELYQKAMDALEVTFLTAPLLSLRPMPGAEAPGGEPALALPLRQQPGFAWSFHAQRGGAWQATRAFDPVETSARLSGRQEISEGWLRLARSDGKDD